MWIADHQMSEHAYALDHKKLIKALTPEQIEQLVDKKIITPTSSRWVQ
jgi:hypothetical protein